METTEWQTIRYVVENGVATLTLNRPAQKNALDAVMREIGRASCRERV